MCDCNTADRAETCTDDVIGGGGRDWVLYMELNMIFTIFYSTCSEVAVYSLPSEDRLPSPGLRTCIRRIMVDQSPISASGLTVAILAAYKTIFHLQRIWIVKGSAPIARFLAVVYVSNAPSTYIVGVVLEATAATTEV